MKAVITHDYLADIYPDDGSAEGTEFDLGSEGMKGRAQTRKFKAYDDDDELYYDITAELADDIDLGDLLNQLGAYAGVTRLKDVTGDGDDWSAS